MTEKTYNVGKGVWKAIKNNLIVFAPAILAFLAGVPPQYAPIASFLTYFIKNWIENREK